MTVRTQISLESELQHRARDKAHQMGISFAEYIRRLVAQDLIESETNTELDQIFDLGDSGNGDIAKNKDTYLGAAAADQYHPPSE